jgi:hypothetical protein
MRNLVPVGRVGLVILAWPLWTVGCAPLIAQICRNLFRLHYAGSTATLVVGLMVLAACGARGRR